MSIQQVAREAGVSVATVSRVFNSPDQVAPATREHIERTAQALGYVPNASARTLRSQRSRVIGVVLPTLINPVFAECLDGIAQAAVANGYAILPMTTDYRVEREEHAVQQLQAANVDGMVLVVSNPGSSQALKQLRARHASYVLAYNRHPDHACVSVDSEQAVASLVTHLHGLGHQRIAMVSGQVAASDRAQQRCRGFMLGMERAGLAASTVLEVPFVHTASQQITALLNGRHRPTALVCSNDLLAIRCIRAARLAGLQVPLDLSVAGFDGIALGLELTPQLSTVAQPNTEMGSRSVGLLLQALALGTPPQPEQSITLPHHWRSGESCAPAP